MNYTIPNLLTFFKIKCDGANLCKILYTKAKFRILQRFPPLYFISKNFKKGQNIRKRQMVISAKTNSTFLCKILKNKHKYGILQKNHTITNFLTS